MVAASGCCMCPHCGAVCTGRFKGCDEVWARGPLDMVPIQAHPAPRPRASHRPRVTNGSAPFQQQVAALTASGPQGSHDELDLLEASLEDLGRLSRRLDDQRGHHHLDEPEPMAANGLQLILEELNVLTKEIRAQRLSWANGDARPVEPPHTSVTPSEEAPAVPPAELPLQPEPPPPSPVRVPRPWSHSVS